LVQLSKQERKQIDCTEYNDPHAIDEMPIQLPGFHGKVLLLIKVTAESTNETDQQED
jgi:hypothetical protein